MLSLMRAESLGSNRQPGGKPKLAAARAIGKSMSKTRLCMELERREMTASRAQSVGNPKIVFTVTSEPRAKDAVIGEPDVSAQGV